MVELPDFTQMALDRIAEGDRETTRRMHEIRDEGGNFAALHYGQGAMMALSAFITFDLSDPDRGPIGVDHWRRQLLKVGALRHVAALPLSERPEALGKAVRLDATRDLWGVTTAAGDAFGVQAAAGMLRACLAFLRMHGPVELVGQIAQEELAERNASAELRATPAASEVRQ